MAFIPKSGASCHTIACYFEYPRLHYTKAKATSLPQLGQDMAFAYCDYCALFPIQRTSLNDARRRNLRLPSGHLHRNRQRHGGRPR